MRQFFKCFFLAFICVPSVYAQLTGFYRIDTIKVSIDGSLIKNPWVGGLNFCLFSEIDLNNDGIKDIFVFDRTGNKPITFINEGIVNTVAYKHAPEYQDKFPDLRDWALMADYNCDGKEDIFAFSYSSNAGIEIYKNISNATEGLKFQLAEDLLLSNYSSTGTNIANIYAKYNDVPAIADIDNDGDLDILSMSQFGITAEYHQNKSLETYGGCDSLNKFQRNTACWGSFSEDASINDVNLGISCKGSGKQESAKTTHTLGSCFLCMDIDGDGDKDFMQGIDQSSNYLMLTNGGTISSADMISEDINFPSYDIPVNLTSFPCGYHLDVNNDGKKDLIVSPFTEDVSENFTSILYYKNVGATNTFTASFQQNNFLQDQMIEVGEGANPVFFDYNADGLQDLLIGNYGYHDISGILKSKISLYENTGTSNHPMFKLITRDFADLSAANVKNLHPTFADLDGDGDIDMMVGYHDGKLNYYENTAGIGNPVNYILSQVDYKDADNLIIDVGNFAAPQLVDVNKDGKTDLIIGAQNGKITYYVNNGTITSPSFSKVTSNFGGINVTKSGWITGYSYPCLFESNNSYKLLVGSEIGYLYYYDNIDGNLSGNFNLVDSTYMNIIEGLRSAPHVADINNDGLKDMVLGNYRGGVTFYGGKIIDNIDENDVIKTSFELYPNPASTEVTIHFASCLPIAGHLILKIYDVTGREVKSQSLSGCTTKINCSDLRSGMYFCKISTNERVYHTVKKLVIQTQ